LNPVDTPTWTSVGSAATPSNYTQSTQPFNYQNLVFTTTSQGLTSSVTNGTFFLSTPAVLSFSMRRNTGTSLGVSANGSSGTFVATSAWTTFNLNFTLPATSTFNVNVGPSTGLGTVCNVNTANWRIYVGSETVELRGQLNALGDVSINGGTSLTNVASGSYIYSSGYVNLAAGITGPTGYTYHGVTATPIRKSAGICDITMSQAHPDGANYMVLLTPCNANANDAPLSCSTSPSLPQTSTTFRVLMKQFGATGQTGFTGADRDFTLAVLK
jgi:hypothetical protein